MKTLLSALFLVCSGTAIACPNLSGTYQHTEYPWNGSINIVQNGCDSAIVTLNRKVTPSSTYPNGIWIVSDKYKTDGLAYEEYTDNTDKPPATSDTHNFVRVQFVNNGISIKSFEGSQRDCGNSYAFNSSKCHVIEQTIGYSTDRQQYEERQTGTWWSESGNYEDDIFPLAKTN